MPFQKWNVLDVSGFTDSLEGRLLLLLISFLIDKMFEKLELFSAFNSAWD
jgi:hypothetical protein